MLKCNNKFCYNNSIAGCSLEFETQTDCDTYNDYNESNLVENRVSQASSRAVQAAENLEQKIKEFADIRGLKCSKTLKSSWRG